MLHDFEYTFGYKNGMTPAFIDSLWAEKSIDSLFEKILTPEEMCQRESLKLYRAAISKVAQEINRITISQVAQEINRSMNIICFLLDKTPTN